jgi:hypothetical protein
VRAEAEARGSRELARSWNVGHETFRKFHMGLTHEPRPHLLRMYRAKFLELHPSGYVREKQVEGPNALEQLKMVLPPGRENAQRMVEQLRDLAARHADELPAEAARLHEWLLKLLKAEYDAEGRMPPPKASRKPKQPKTDE